ncbi:hypothetical protein OG923_00160 [Streptomyces halstedii]|uniref:hypothetical protein n=1 Tax=Streptomyces halstedii TaxID=1944 RepID=UPI003243517B
MVVTELERITADPDGAGGKVWRTLGRDEDEWQTLGEALDNPDGDRLYAVQREEAHRRQKEREAAEREAQRPGVRPRYGAKFTGNRWQSIRQSKWRSKRDDLCGPRLNEHHQQPCGAIHPGAPVSPTDRNVGGADGWPSCPASSLSRA